MARSVEDFESNMGKFQIENTFIKLSVKKTVSYCSCCLAESLALISTSNCSHYNYYKQFFDIKNLFEEEYICVICHEILRKIENFNNMILESYHILANNVTLLNKHRKKYVDFGISQQAANFVIEYNDTVNDKQIKTEELTEEDVSFDDDNSFDDNNIVSIDKTPSNIQDGFKPNFQFKIMPYCDAEKPEIKIKPPVLASDPVLNESTENEQWMPYIKPEFEDKVKFVLLTKEEYEKEMKDNYKKYDNKCEHCLVGFKYKKFFEAHMEDIHINPIKNVDTKKKQLCIYCKSYVKPPFIEHQKKHFVRYECRVCQLRFTQLQGAINHYMTKHDQANKKYKCMKCDYVTTNQNDYKRHSEVHYEGLPCDQCDKVFTNNKTLSKHQMRKHSNVPRENAFECNICKKRLATKGNLAKHVNFLHGDDSARVACSTCGKIFKNNTLLRCHIKIHEVKFTCHDCGKRCSMKHQLLRHILMVHLKKDLSVVCPECGKRCPDKLCLKGHRAQQHTVRKVRELLCQVCGKKFTCPKSLLDHMNTHTGARPHVCKFCGARFGHAASLYTHTRLKHYDGKRKRDRREEEI